MIHKTINEIKRAERQRETRRLDRYLFVNTVDDGKNRNLTEFF